MKPGGMNYDFDRKAPRKMGEGSFANLPEKEYVKPVSTEVEYRDGLPNSFTAGISKDSGICENRG